MGEYVIGIAGCYGMWSHPDNPGVQIPLPRVVSLTSVPQECWPIWHKVFGRDDLTGLWWYAPAHEARPVLEAAITYFDAHRAELGPLLALSDYRGVDGNAKVLQRVLADLNTHDDNVIAWGRV